MLLLAALGQDWRAEGLAVVPVLTAEEACGVCRVGAVCSPKSPDDDVYPDAASSTLFLLSHDVLSRSLCVLSHGRGAEPAGHNSTQKGTRGRRERHLVFCVCCKEGGVGAFCLVCSAFAQCPQQQLHSPGVVRHSLCVWEWSRFVCAHTPVVWALSPISPTVAHFVCARSLFATASLSHDQNLHACNNLSIGASILPV